MVIARKDFRPLCREIFKRYKKSHDLLYIDACEIADLVAWGVKTKDELFATMDMEISA